MEQFSEVQFKRQSCIVEDEQAAQVMVVDPLLELEHSSMMIDIWRQWGSWKTTVDQEIVELACDVRKCPLAALLSNIEPKDPVLELLGHLCIEGRGEAGASDCKQRKVRKSWCSTHLSQRALRRSRLSYRPCLGP